MKHFLIELEEMNLRMALKRLRNAKSQRAWSVGQGAVFGALGLLYIVFILTGSSIFYLFSVAIYFAATAFFWKWAWGRWTRAIWSSLRDVADARIRLREAMKEED